MEGDMTGGGERCERERGRSAHFGVRLSGVDLAASAARGE